MLIVNHYLLLLFQLCPMATFEVASPFSDLVLASFVKAGIDHCEKKNKKTQNALS